MPNVVFPQITMSHTFKFIVCRMDQDIPDLAIPTLDHALSKLDGCGPMYVAGAHIFFFSYQALKDSTMIEKWRILAQGWPG